MAKPNVKNVALHPTQYEIARNPLKNVPMTRALTKRMTEIAPYIKKKLKSVNLRLIKTSHSRKHANCLPGKTTASTNSTSL